MQLYKAQRATEILVHNNAHPLKPLSNVSFIDRTWISSLKNGIQHENIHIDTESLKHLYATWISTSRCARLADRTFRQFRVHDDTVGPKRKITY